MYTGHIYLHCEVLGPHGCADENYVLLSHGVAAQGLKSKISDL